MYNDDEIDMLWGSPTQNLSWTRVYDLMGLAPSVSESSGPWCHDDKDHRGQGMTGDSAASVSPQLHLPHVLQNTRDGAPSSSSTSTNRHACAYTQAHTGPQCLGSMHVMRSHCLYTSLSTVLFQDKCHLWLHLGPQFKNVHAKIFPSWRNRKGAH